MSRKYKFHNKQGAFQPLLVFFTNKYYYTNRLTALENTMKKRKLKFIVLLILLGINYSLVSQNRIVTISYKKNPDKSIDFSYKKTQPGSFYLTVTFPKLENANFFGFKGVINSSSGHLFRLRPIFKDKHVRFSYKYSFKRGVPNPKVDSLFQYTLPFKKGKTVKVFESSYLLKDYFGSEKPTNWKSYVSNRTIADTVCAMRKGIVVKIVNKYESDTLDQYKYTSQKNRLIIEHADGTFASYKGFKKNSIFVKLGQTVYPQTQLGTLAIFNNSTYQLHFNIHYLVNKKIDSKRKKTLKNYKSHVAFLTPYFHTTEGQIKLKKQYNYTTVFNKTILLNEMTKREKKKYKKTPELFD